MPVVDHLEPRRALLLDCKTKRAALRALANAVCHDYPALSPTDVLKRIEARERQLSTLIEPDVAIPHARLPHLPEMVIAVGLHRSGLRWQTISGERARLVILVLGNEDQPVEHIRVLADIARLLSHEANLEALLAASSGRALYSAFVAAESAARKPRLTRKDRLTRQLLSHAADLTTTLPKAAVMVHDDGSLQTQWLDVFGDKIPTILVSGDVAVLGEPERPGVELLQVPARGLATRHRIELAIMLAISQGLIGPRCTVINVYGDGPRGGLDAVSVVDVAQSFERVLALHREMPSANIDHRVLNRVLNIALSLASQGREGKPVGTIFVVGDDEAVGERSNQIVINPFRGYADDERNILDPSLEETVKEFASIDGAFLIRGDGVILAAGACLHIDPDASRLSSGLGTRHVAGASITAHTNALSVVVSESTGAVTIFKGGKQILVLEKMGW